MKRVTSPMQVRLKAIGDVGLKAHMLLLGGEGHVLAQAA